MHFLNLANKIKQINKYKFRELVCFLIGTQDQAAEVQDSVPLSKHPRKFTFRFKPLIVNSDQKSKLEIKCYCQIQKKNKHYHVLVIFTYIFYLLTPGK